MFTIKDVTQRLHLTVHTVRHYCDKGLVPNLSYDKYGNRLFNEESLHWLQATVFLKKSGLALADIKHYFDLCQKGEKSLQERQKMIQDLKEKAQKDLIDAQYRFDCLSQQVELFHAIQSGKEKDRLNPLTWR